MGKYKGSFRALMWCVALAMTAVAAGCGRGGDDNNSGGRGTGRGGLGAGPTPPNRMSLTTHNFLVLTPTNVTLSGGANDTWIFQISGDITMASAARIQLTGGALPSNVFWQVAGGTGVALGTTSHLEGTVLAAKAITVATGATVKGRLLSQTTVTLDANTVGP